MSKHPALKWVTNIHYPGRVTGEAHIFDNSVKNYHHMLKLGRSGEWGVTTPEANATDVVIDCESSPRPILAVSYALT